jgi:hypothetical protein
MRNMKIPSSSIKTKQTTQIYDMLRADGYLEVIWGRQTDRPEAYETGEHPKSRSHGGEFHKLSIKFIIVHIVCTGRLLDNDGMGTEASVHAPGRVAAYTNPTQYTI